MVNVIETHLTKKQFEILRMRMEGKSLAEIAKRFGTSRSNVSRIARMAEQNIEKSKNTVKLVETMNWPVKVHVRAGENIYEVSEMVFREADGKRIDVSHNYSEIVRLITESLGRKNIRRRKTLKNFTILVNDSGRVEVI